MSKLNKTRFAILGMLTIAPMSGYEMRQIMLKSTGNFWSESDGQLYPALARLAAQGLVSCTSDKSSAREKKIYKITVMGMDELTNWLKQEAETNIVRSESLLKLFFGANVAPEISLEHIQVMHDETRAMLSRLAETSRHLDSEFKHSPHLEYWQMTIDYGLRLGVAKLLWCEDAINKLQKNKRGKKS